MDKDMQKSEAENCSKRIKLDSKCLKLNIKCTVCGADATGCHYRVISCDDCKHFFQRTIIEEKEYKCSIKYLIKFSHSYCEGCHFQKCLNAGMYPEAVDVVKAQKRKLHAFLKLKLKFYTILPFGTNCPFWDFGIEEFNVIEDLIVAHQLSYKQTDITACKRTELKFSKESIFTESTSDLHCENFDVVADFFKSISYFKNLPATYQKFLLDRACFTIMFFRFCTRYFEETGSFVLPNFSQFTYGMLEDELGHSHASGIPRVVNIIKRRLPPRYYAIWEFYCLIQENYDCIGASHWFHLFPIESKRLRLYLVQLLLIIKNYILGQGELLSCIKFVYQELDPVAGLVKPRRDDVSNFHWLRCSWVAPIRRQ